MAVILYIAVSVDNYIATPDGSVDWLMKYDGQDYGYYEFFDRIGSVVLGNKTYKQILEFGKYPYEGVDSYVFTRKKERDHDKNVTFVTGDLTEFVEKTKQKTDKDIWLVGGSALIKGFMEQDLVDEYIITTIPILLGDGIPLFYNFGHEIELELKDSEKFDNGVMTNTYIPLKK